MDNIPCELLKNGGKAILVSWCFKPSQPQRIISGLKETLMKGYVVERTNKAGIRLEEHNNSPDSDMSDLGDKGMAEGMDTITRHTFTK